MAWCGKISVGEQRRTTPADLWTLSSEEHHWDVQEKQYQLWAIVDGHPVDAGVFNVDIDLTFIKLKTISKAESFVITLEKKGGSTTPTLNEMYVFGKVTG